jgi:hypothetical protein
MTMRNDLPAINELDGQLTEIDTLLAADTIEVKADGGTAYLNTECDSDAWFLSAFRQSMQRRRGVLIAKLKALGVQA